jgi:hypothetical protein
MQVPSFLRQVDNLLTVVGDFLLLDSEIFVNLDY